MDDYKKIPFDDPDLCVPDLDDFDQMKEFFLDCAAEYFRYSIIEDILIQPTTFTMAFDPFR